MGDNNAFAMWEGMIRIESESQLSLNEFLVELGVQKEEVSAKLRSKFLEGVNEVQRDFDLCNETPTLRNDPTQVTIRKEMAERFLHSIEAQRSSRIYTIVKDLVSSYTRNWQVH